MFYKKLIHIYKQKEWLQQRQTNFEPTATLSEKYRAQIL
jgi:hypothetical protein